MNLKKFISGVSALTIAASAFAGMAVVANAETNTLLECGTADAEWTADTLAKWTAGGSPALADGVVTISGGNGGYETSKTIAPTENAVIDVEAVWRAASNTGRAFSAGNGSYFRFGNIIVAQNDQDMQHGYGFTGLANIGSVTKFGAGSYRVAVSDSTWLKITMQIDTASSKLNSFKITSEDGATTYASAENVALASPDYTTVAFGYKKGGGVSTTNTEQLKSVKITETPQQVQTANYTIKHVGPNDVQVKEDQVKSSVVGDSIVLSTDDKADVAGQYYYVSDDSAEKTVAADGTTVVTVTYRAADPYTATVTAKSGEDTIGTFSADAADSSASVKVYYTKYIAADGKYYVTAPNGAYPSYAKNFTEAGNADVAYTEATDVLFASEVENLKASHSWAADGGTPDRYSNGGAKRLYKNSYVTVWTAEADSNVTVSLWSRNQASKNATSIDVYLMDADGTIAESAAARFADWNAGACEERTTDEIFVPAGYTIIINNTDTSNNSNLEMDYVAVKGSVVAPTEVDGIVAVAETFSGDKYDGEATALTATFDITGATVNTVTVTPDGEQVAGEAKSQAIPATSETTLVYGIVVNKIVDKNAFTAKATFVE